MLKCWVVEMFGMLKCLECLNVGLMRSWDVEMFGMLKCWNVEMLKC